MAKKNEMLSSRRSSPSRDSNPEASCENTLRGSRRSDQGMKPSVCQFPPLVFDSNSLGAS